jgi:hypothetical protein
MLSEKNYKLLIRFKERSIDVPEPMPERYQQMIDEGYMRIHETSINWIEPSKGNEAKLEITEKGIDECSAYDEMLKKQAQDKADKRKEHRFQIFLALLSFVLGLVTQYFSDIIGIITGIFS